MDQPSSQKIPSSSLDAWFQKSDEFARREPAKAVASAAGLGFIINLLPLGFIAGALTSVLFALARPVLLFLGVMKACELCRTEQQKNA